MNNFEIREMTHDDIDDILQIEEMCYGAHHWSRESFLTELSNKISTYRCVVNSDKKCVGYMGIWKIMDEAHVTNLSVHPEYQNKKLAICVLLIFNMLQYKCFYQMNGYHRLSLLVRHNLLGNMYLYLDCFRLLDRPMWSLSEPIHH